MSGSFSDIWRGESFSNLQSEMSIQHQNQLKFVYDSDEHYMFGCLEDAVPYFRGG